MINTDKDWEAFGQSDPYFGVLTHPRYRDANRAGPARDEFFASGVQEVAESFQIIRAVFDPAFAPRRTLEFGCGVGRLTIPLASESSRVIGVDVSPSMIAEAQRNCREAGAENVSFVLSDDSLSRLTGNFDFLFSSIVFQHIPRVRGERILQAMLQRLEAGGVGRLHFTYSTPAPGWVRLAQLFNPSLAILRTLYNWRHSRPWRDPIMMMCEYNLNRILRLIQSHGCPSVHLTFTDHGGHLGAVLFFQKSSTT